MSFMKRLLLMGLAAVFAVSNIIAQSGFIVRKIRVEGLQRVNLSTILSYLPIKQGQMLKPGDTGTIVSSLYSTGFFSNVSLARQGNDLIITVQERPIIGDIKITGNKKIQTKNLQQVLKNIGIQEGNAYDSSILEGLQQSLQQQYYNMGMYDAKVTTTATPQPRDRVAINISIYEGKPAHIKKITIVGNHAFSQRKLLRQFQQTTWRPWTILTHSDQYSEDKLNQDLQTLHDFYLDHGYLRFNIDSKNVNLSPDKKTVEITINVTEGAQYRVSGYTLAGNLLGQDEAVRNLVNIRQGEIFSRQKILAIDNAIVHLYGDQGYAFANVNPVPSIDDAHHEVFLTFQVDPGRRVYVRSISFTGNTKTQEIVLRREMRQEEGGLYSLSNIEEGKRRLSNLGYLQNVAYKTTPVPGTTDQVDLNYDVSEMSSATASVQAGYSDMYGFLYGANLTENNLLGTGKQVSLGFENSQYSDMYSFTYANPYYTESGISRAISVFAQHTTPGNVNQAPYTANAYGGNVSYGLPISEYSGLNFGYGYQHLNVQESGADLSPQIVGYLNQHGRNYDVTTLNGGWMRSTYDRALMPTSGTKQLLSGEVGVPVFRHPLDYYKVNYEAALYHPLPHNFVFHMAGDIGYGYGYGPFNDGLPFFKNYFAGGIDSVRGYEANTLGPLDMAGNPIGGNVLTSGTISLIIPNPLTDKLRPSIFVDGGNVFQNQVALGKVRYSVGLGVEFYIPMVGPLEFALAEPLNPGKSDQPEHFEFSVGTSF